MSCGLPEAFTKSLPTYLDNPFSRRVNIQPKNQVVYDTDSTELESMESTAALPFQGHRV